MAVNAASSSYVNNASSNKGFSGLASGVDTESMVEQLLSGTQQKIDKQNALKQQLEWKQEIYRDLISQINSFQTKFFSYSSDSNLLSESFFNAMSAATSSTAFKATATSSAVTGSSTIEVRRLATKTSLASGEAVSGRLLGGMDKEALEKLVKDQVGTDEDYTLKFQVGSKEVSVNLRDVFVKDDQLRKFDSSTQRDAEIQAKLEEAFKDTGVEVSVKDGAMSLVTQGEKRDNILLDPTSGKLGLSRLGLTATSKATSRASDQTTTFSGKVDDTPKLEFTVGLDDVRRTVTIDLRDVMKGGKVDEGAFKDVLRKALDKAHGEGQITVGGTGGSFELSVSAGRKVEVGGNAEALSAMGLKAGQSNRIGLGMKLGDLSLSKSLQGGSFRFKINGEEFHFTEENTVAEVLEAVNTSKAGVRMIYRAQNDTFVLEATESGAGKQIDLSQEEGNLLNAFFGLNTATKQVRSKALVKTVPDPDGKLKEATGETKLKDLGFTLTDRDGKELDGDTKLSDLASVSGGKYTFTGDEIREEVTGDTTLGDLGLSFYGMSGDVKLSQLEERSNGRFLYEDGHIILAKSYTATGPNGIAAMEKMFGTTSIKLNTQLEGMKDLEDIITQGQNALVVIDGMVTERSGNNFTVNGINYDVSDLTGEYALVEGTIQDGSGNPYTLQQGEYIESGKLYNANGDVIGSGFVFVDGEGKETVATGLSLNEDGKLQKFSGTPAKVEVSQNTDQIMDGIKSFMDEYNKLIKTINDYLDEDTNYRDYAPLTADQKKEMSEREIELWEEKAKEGLLHRDNTLQTFLQQMRTALYEKPAGGGYALYELGIETGSWETKGQLTFTTDGEARLRQLLETDAGNVMKLFTAPEDGLGAKLNNILNSTAKISSGSPGTLVQLAGVKGTGTEKSNSIYDQLKALDEKIAALKRTYEAEKTRYWNQFNTMEQMISNMNAQSSYLAQMMGG